MNLHMELSLESRRAQSGGLQSEMHVLFLRALRLREEINAMRCDLFATNAKTEMLLDSDPTTKHM
jgi:hypothetical protein